jgi:hypothetical protein
MANDLIVNRLSGAVRMLAEARDAGDTPPTRPPAGPPAGEEVVQPRRW